MQIKNVTYGTTYKQYKNYMECLNMIESLKRVDKSEIAKERLKIIKFYEQYGEKITKQAYGVDRKVISRWRKRLKERNGDIQALVPISTRPNRFRQAETDLRIIERIRQIRQERYRLCKYKIKVYLDKFCQENGLKKISVSTIGLIIKRNNMFYQPAYKLPIHRAYKRDKNRIRIKYCPKVKEPGTIIADTEIVMCDGIRRYFYNAIDAQNKFAFSCCFDELTSKNMVVFYEKFKQVYPFKIKVWQNDNGHENLGFMQEKLKQDGIKQVFSYPRCPKINAYVERFNRTIKEEFIDENAILFREKELFNNLLSDWLIYYNLERPHFSLDLLSPLQFINLNYKMSHMYLTNTVS